MGCESHLSCPVCGSFLAREGGRAVCPNGHSFDYARSGYLNLTAGGGGRSRVGDTREMVRARAELLEGGLLAPVCSAVARSCTPARGEAACLAELGSGTGYYLRGAVDHLRGREAQPACALGIDLSKAAAAHAARRQKGLQFVVADVQARIPLLDGAADVLLSVFAPRPAEESARVLRPGGLLVAAFAGAEHLRGLRRRWKLLSVHPDKLAQLTERTAPWFDLASLESVEYDVRLSPEDALRLWEMGPNARHGSAPGAPAAAVDDHVSVQLARFERR